MKLSDALEAYFEDCGTDSRLPNFFVEEVRKLEAIVEGSSNLLENNTVGELLAGGLEEITEDVSKTPSKYQGYVVRVSDYTSSVLGFVGYNDIDTIEDYTDRSVYGRFVEAKSDMDKFNAANKESLFSAQVILNGSRGYCDYAPECEEPSSHKESKTQEGFSPRKYVVRTHTGNGEFLGYTSDYSHSKGASKNYSQRKRYPDLSYAAYDAAKYNEINSKKRWYGVEYYCYAVVIPDGTEEECLEATPVWQEEQ